jgi:hypothetical protein
MHGVHRENPEPLLLVLARTEVCKLRLNAREHYFTIDAV